MPVFRLKKKVTHKKTVVSSAEQELPLFGIKAWVEFGETLGGRWRVNLMPAGLSDIMLSLGFVKYNEAYNMMCMFQDRREKLAMDAAGEQGDLVLGSYLERVLE